MAYGKAYSLQDKPLVKGDRGQRLIDLLAKEKLDVHVIHFITPYLIPTDNLLKTLKNDIKNGKKIKVIVPSMASNNHTMVHSFYKKYRKELLEMGLEIYEFSAYPSERIRKLSDTYPVKSKFVSLHMKAFFFDEDLVWIGSLNLDPRSININTEHILVIKSKKLAKMLEDNFSIMSESDNAWKVYIDKKGKVRWRQGDKILKLQPARSTWQRFTASLYRLMPIEGQL